VKCVVNVCDGTEGKRLCGDIVCVSLSELYAAVLPCKVHSELS
jgi:hypothetical protein